MKTLIEDSYIRLFNEHRQMLDCNVSEVFNACRESAYNSFCKWGLPSEHNENYLNSNLKEWFAPDFGMNLRRLDMLVETNAAFRCNVPSLKTDMHTILNDTYERPQAVCKQKYPEGVLVGSLNELSKSRSEFVGTYYNKLAKMDGEGIAAFNAMFAQDGFFLFVPSGISLEIPIHLVSLSQSSVNLLVNRRLLIILGKGAKVKLLLCDHALSRVNILSTQVIEAFVGQDAALEVYDLEETHSDNHKITELYCYQEAGSSVSHTSLALHNGKTRNSYFFELAGPGATLELNGVAITDKSQRVDNSVIVDHIAPDCVSNQLYKYVLDEKSIGSFSGKVLVRQGSQRTVSRQTNRNICLSKESQMFTKPQLEIYADDVKCGHGATVGQLDDTALFYMRQRGISSEEARMMLMLAFVNEVLDQVALTPLRERLRSLVEKRFRRELYQCEGCTICK